MDCGETKESIPYLDRSWVRDVLQHRRDKEGNIRARYHERPADRPKSWQDELEEIYLARGYLPWRARLEARKQVQAQTESQGRKP